MDAIEYVEEGSCMMKGILRINGDINLVLSLVAIKHHPMRTNSLTVRADWLISPSRHNLIAT